MQTKLLRNWCGSLAVTWMVGVYFFLRYSTAADGLFRLILLWLWLSVGFLLAVLGLRCRSFAGRVSALLALGLFLFFTWDLLCPRVRAVRASFRPNNVTSADGGIPLQAVVVAQWPAAAEFLR